MKISGPAKCCFCIPLRKGLLCVGYTRLMICLCAIVQLTLMCVLMFRRMEDSYNDAVTFFESVASIITQLLDLMFTLMFIVAAHKKNLKYFELYYYYSITMVFVYLLTVVLIACDMQRFDILYYIMIFLYSWGIAFGYYELIIVGAITIVLQAYLALLVKSEVHKLRERSKAEFARQRPSEVDMDVYKEV